MWVLSVSRWYWNWIWGSVYGRGRYELRPRLDLCVIYIWIRFICPFRQTVQSHWHSHSHSQNAHNLRNLWWMCVSYVCGCMCVWVDVCVCVLTCAWELVCLTTFCWILWNAKKPLIKQRDLPDRCQIWGQRSAISSTFVCQLWQNMQFAHLQTE